MNNNTWSNWVALGLGSLNAGWQAYQTHGQTPDIHVHNYPSSDTPAPTAMNPAWIVVGLIGFALVTFFIIKK